MDFTGKPEGFRGRNKGGTDPSDWVSNLSLQLQARTCSERPRDGRDRCLALSKVWHVKDPLVESASTFWMSQSTVHTCSSSNVLIPWCHWSPGRQRPGCCCRSKWQSLLGGTFLSITSPGVYAGLSVSKDRKFGGGGCWRGNFCLNKASERQDLTN